MGLRSFGFVWLFTFILFSPLAQAQSKKITQQGLLWLEYNNTLRFSSRWQLVSEVHARRFINPGKAHEFVLRSQLYRRLGENWDASAGFTYSGQSPDNPLATDVLVVPELRPHIQFDFRQELGKLSIAHRYRAEKRFFRNTENGDLADGYASNYRLRYRLDMRYQLAEINSQPLTLRVYNELHINAGENIVYNRFHQNRLSGGFNQAISRNFEVELGYIYWFQQQDTGNEFYSRHVVNFIINHRINLSGSSGG
jgi:hypothetical protein